jgi:hypothetical protein
MKPPNRDSPFSIHLDLVGTEIVVRNLPNWPKMELFEIEVFMGILRNMGILPP